MATNEDLIEQIEENAQAPASVTVDGTSASQHSLRDQIELDRYQRDVAATKNTTGLGITLRRLKPPGTI